MRRLLILGAGTAGTTVANKLRRQLGTRDWIVTAAGRTSISRACSHCFLREGAARQRVSAAR